MVGNDNKGTTLTTVKVLLDVYTQITLTLKCMKHGSYRWRKRLERGVSGFIFYSKPSESEEQLLLSKEIEGQRVIAAKCLFLFWRMPGMYL